MTQTSDLLLKGKTGRVGSEQSLDHLETFWEWWRGELAGIPKDRTDNEGGERALERRQECMHE